MSRRDAALRRAVIARDGGRCKMIRDGKVCGRPATTANHRQRQRDGGRETLANMEAACSDCNCTDGGLSRFEGVPAPARLTARQRAIVELLDAAELRSDAGRRAALRVLQRITTGEAKQPCPAPRLAHLVTNARSADVDAACRWRRARARASMGVEAAVRAAAARKRW